MNTEPTKERPPRSIVELENSTWKWQFSLGKLIVATNLLGVMVAVVVASRGYALSIALAFGFLFAIVSPMLVFSYVFIQSIFDRFYSQTDIETFSESECEADPFEE